MRYLLGLCAALALGLSGATAMAADLTGTWTGELQMGGNGLQITYNFKQDGAKLSGTVQGPQGDSIEILNGAIDGEKFSFDINYNGSTIHNDCTLDGDAIKLTMKTDQGNMDMTLKRADAAAPQQPSQPGSSQPPPQSGSQQQPSQPGPPQ